MAKAVAGAREEGGTAGELGQRNASSPRQGRWAVMGARAPEWRRKKPLCFFLLICD
jgi:hypothetical protein